MSIAGQKIISGGNSLATGVVDLGRTEEIVRGLIQKGFGYISEPGALEVKEDTTLSRETYVSMFGPTVGDRVRLGDTELWLQVEHDMVSTIRRAYFNFGNWEIIRQFMETKSSLEEVSV